MTMKKTFLIFVAAITVLSLTACSFGSLTSAKAGGSKTTLSLSLGTLQSDSSGKISRAIVQGGGYLYIRTIGDSSGSSGALYGPYAVSAGSDFSTNDISAGTYSKILVLYSARELDNVTTYAVLGGTYTWLGFMQASDQLLAKFFDTMGTDARDPGADAIGNGMDGTATFGMKENVTMRAGQETSLSVVLQPILGANSSIDLASSNTKTFTSAESAMVRKFYQIDGLTVSLPVSAGVLTCTISAASESAGSIGKVAFFDANGRAISATKSGSSLSGGYTWTIDAATANSIAETSTVASTGYVGLFMYIEYTGTVSAKFDNLYPPNVKVSVSGSATSAWQGRKFLFAVYDETTVAKLAAGESMSVQTPVGLGIVNLDSSTGSGETTIQATGLTGGKNYYLMAMVDSTGQYTGVSDLGSIDLSTVIPYQNDYTLNSDAALTAKGVYRLKSFAAGSPVSLTTSDFSQTSDYVYFVSQSGGGSGNVPSSPTTMTAALSSAAGQTGTQIYMTGNISLAPNQSVSGSEHLTIQSYGLTPYTLTVTSLSAQPLFAVSEPASLEFHDIVIASPASTVYSPVFVVVAGTPGNGGSLSLGSRTTLAGCTAGQATTCGGIQLNAYGKLEMWGATIRDCYTMSPAKGGAIYVAPYAQCLISNTTITNCSASQGGAIYFDNNTFGLLKSVLIKANTTGTAGNGAIVLNGAGAQVQASNVVFDSNTPTDTNTYLLQSGATWTAIP